MHVIGTSGNDVVHLMTKNSRRYVDAAGAPVTAGTGCKVDPNATIPTVICREAVWSAALGAGDDTVIVRGKTRSFLDGGPGNDTFVGGTGADTFAGGDGFDTVDYRGRPGMNVVIGGGPHSGAKGERDTIDSDIERVLLPS